MVLVSLRSFSQIFNMKSLISFNWRKKTELIGKCKSLLHLINCIILYYIHYLLQSRNKVNQRRRIMQFCQFSFNIHLSFFQKIRQNRAKMAI